VIDCFSQDGRVDLQLSGHQTSSRRHRPSAGPKGWQAMLHGTAPTARSNRRRQSQTRRPRWLHRVSAQSRSHCHSPQRAPMRRSTELGTTGECRYGK
jgi:hypothetical protein